MTNQLTALLVEHEGISQELYTDTKGHLTIGIGHNLDANPLPDDTLYPLSIEQCYEILASDVARVQAELSEAFVWYSDMDPVRQGALVDLCFNIGIADLETFHAFLIYMQQSNWNSAAGDLLSTLYARQLPSRAADLATMIRTGEWPSSIQTGS